MFKVSDLVVTPAQIYRPVAHLQVADLDPIVGLQQGVSIFDRSLKLAKDGPILVKLLAQFIEFNSVFAGEVANLAGAAAKRKTTFKDVSEKIEQISDKSWEVAAPIFFAALDEFVIGKTHRSMAADTLREIAHFYDFSMEYTNKLIAVNDDTIKAIEKVHEGYCHSQETTDSRLLKGIGFHIGSEVLADQEFNTLAARLKSDQPDLVKHLIATNSWSWIAVHTIVEKDHFEKALSAANLAIRYYQGEGDARFLILEGFANFAAVQVQFMNSLYKLAASDYVTMR